MKVSKKEMKAQIINEVSKQFKNTYESKINRLESEVKNLRETNKELYTQSREAKRRADELEEKVVLYEEWINRLQEFCNLPDDARDKAIDDFKKSMEAEKAMGETFGMVAQMFRNYMF